jgi:glycosyltransferase involved in cell wall biosynthesis
MKILYATDNFPPPYSGHAIAVINMAEEMKSKGHDVIIVAPSPFSFKNYSRDLAAVTKVPDNSGSAGIRVFYLRSIPLFCGDNALKSMAIDKKLIIKIITDFEPNIIHYNGWGPLCKKVLRAQEQANKIETVATCHGVPMHVTSRMFIRNSVPRVLEKIIWKMMARFYGKMKIVISPSNFVNDKLINAGLAVNKGTVLSNGIDTHSYRRHEGMKKREVFMKHKIPPDKIHITYIGRLDPEKNIEILMKMVEYFQPNKNVFFIVAGSGRLRRKIESFARKGDYNIFLLDWLDHEDVVDILGVSDIFFIPSPSESQSITTLEAMASYLPVVAANEGALPDLVENSRNGFLFINNVPDSCAEKLKILVNNRRLIAKFGLESRKRALQHDKKNVMDRLEKIYRSLISAQ